MSHGKRKTDICAFGLIALVFLAGAPAGAKGGEGIEVDTSDIGTDTNGVITSDQFLELGVPSANGLRIEGEQALRMGKIDRAVKVLQKSVELAPRDMDGRILYAEALEKKLLRQKDRDPELFNFVVKQWLFVAKSAEFADQGQQGYNHLYKLTGTVPKKREKERKYLERTLIPEDGSVKVQIGKRMDGKTVNTDPIAHKKPEEQDL